MIQIWRNTLHLSINSLEFIQRIINAIPITRISLTGIPEVYLPGDIIGFDLTQPDRDAPGGDW